ncbi:hypothetical protein Pelo_18949 [Pelomyxa schiedti]|nr:hypothetical protein Pelo_18949 [Pelomyxa schiedti]
MDRVVNEIQAQLSPETLLLILVENSNNVGRDNFVIVKDILSLIIGKTTGMMRSIIDFSNSARTVCPFTNDETMLMNAVKGTDEMVPCGSTRT